MSDFPQTRDTKASDGNDYYATQQVPSVPAGVISMWASATAPNGWLICDGSPISRTTYAELFSVVGTTWGSGDGSTTFNIPDLRNKTIRAVGSSYSLASTGGADSVVLTANNLPVHTHAINDPGHTHTLVNASIATTNATPGSLASPAPGQAYSNVNGAPLETLASASTGITVGNNTTTADAVALVNAYVAVNYIIKTVSVVTL